MRIVFLGTSSMVPTKERNHSATLILYKNEGILVDCGEGTQRQLKFANIKATKITKILITHWHGDHVFGLPGLLQTLGASDYEGTLKIYGPVGTRERFKKVMEAFVLTDKVEVEVNEVERGVFFENDDFRLIALPLKHSIRCLGYRFEEKDTRKMDIKKIRKLGIPEGPLIGKLQEGNTIKVNGKIIRPEEVSRVKKGRVIGFIADTGMCNNAVAIGKDADILISEATHLSKHEEKAILYKHLTAKQAALIASNANAKKLILNHFSQRYKTTDEIIEEARAIFPNVIAATDLMVVGL